LQTDGRIVVHGQFHAIGGRLYPGLVRLRANGTVDDTFLPAPEVAGAPKIFLQPDGRIIFGARWSWRRLNADGSLDQAFSIEADRDINDISIQPDGKIVLGGAFEAVAGRQQRFLARLNGDGTVDESFVVPAGTVSDFVNLVELQEDGRLLVQGEFGLKRLNTDGSPDTSFTPAYSGRIIACVLQHDGKILLGGDLSLNGKGIVRLHPNGSLDASFDPGSGLGGSVPYVGAIAVQQNGKILISGRFSGFDGADRVAIARLNSDGSVDANFDTGSGPAGLPGYYPSVGNTTVRPDGMVIVAGSFEGFNGRKRRGIALLTPDGNVDASFDPLFEDRSWMLIAAVQPDEKIVIAGSFKLVNGSARAGVARLRPDGTIDETFDPGGGANDTIHSIALQPDGKVLLGGMFTSFDGVPRNAITRVDTNGRPDSAFNPGTGPNRGNWLSPTGVRSPVHSILHLPDGKILAGGYFTNFNGHARNGLVRLLPDGGVDQSFDAHFGYTNAFAYIDSGLALPDGKMVFGASFFGFYTNPQGGLGFSRYWEPSGLFRLNADGSVDTSFLVPRLPTRGSDGPRWFSLGLQTDGRIVGAADTGVRRVYRLEANGSVDPGFETNAFPELTYSMQQLVVQRNDKILVGGPGIRRLNPDGTHDHSFDSVNAGIQQFVWSIALNKDQTWLATAGAFESLNGMVRHGLARVFTVERQRLIAPGWSPVGQMTFLLVGEAGLRHRIDVSSDLMQWSPLQTVVLSNSQQMVVHATSSNATYGFYRAVLVP